MVQLTNIINVTTNLGFFFRFSNTTNFAGTYDAIYRFMELQLGFNTKISNSGAYFFS